MAYKTLGMMKNGGMQKDINDLMAGVNGTDYLLANQREVHRVTVSQHKRMVQDGFLLNTAGGHQGQYIFVMDGEGAIYSADKHVVQHHSAFLAGGPVAAAGWWSVEYGALKSISNISGHYQPPLDYTQQILVELKRMGLDISGVVQNWTGTTSKAFAKRSAMLGVNFERIGPKGVINSAY